MALSNMALQLHKPFFTGIEIRTRLDYFKRVNVNWWLIRIPMVLLAMPAAYGVGSFAREYLPPFWSGLAGAAFESAYIGAIALADQQLEDEKTIVWGREINVTWILWWASNVCAVVFSMLSNLLFFSGGQYKDITPEIATHAIPMPLLGFVYGLLVHNYSTRLSARNRKEFLAKPHVCEYCNLRFERAKQRNGHMSRCNLRPAKP